MYIKLAVMKCQHCLKNGGKKTEEADSSGEKVKHEMKKTYRLISAEMSD